MFTYEGGFPQLVFHGFFKVQHLQARQAALGQVVLFFIQAQFFQGLAQPLGVVHVVASFGVGQDRFADGQSGKGFGQVNRFAVVGQEQGAHGFFGGIAHQTFCELHQVLVIPVGRIKLHHGEFGVVPHRYTFIAKVAVDLKHPLKTADHQALQVQLGGNAQEHLLVQGIVVGAKRLGIGPTRDGVQHGRFNFQKAMAHHVLADAADRFAARHKAFARAFIGHQVDVALAVFDFLVVHTVELVGHGAQAFGQQANLGHMDRQLAGAGFEQAPFGADDVTQVPVLEVVVDVFANFVARQIQLDAPGAVLHGGKAGFAHHPLEHHPSRHPGQLALLGQHFRGFVAMAVMQGGRMVGRFEIIGKGHGTTSGLALAQHLEFVTAFRDELVLVLWGISGGGGVRHGAVVMGTARNAAGQGLKDRRGCAKQAILGGSTCGCGEAPCRCANPGQWRPIHGTQRHEHCHRASPFARPPQH